MLHIHSVKKNSDGRDERALVLSVISQPKCWTTGKFERTIHFTAEPVEIC